ncbi:MAG: TIGR03747 family integrating conjugative element membrane protein, partial [Klebsiella michiganensis]|nr:TIGR03747 family integrating conjugative element membrane protein [Klebsiella michiganensis]
MAEVKRPPQQQTLPERKHGILYNLLWGWPWALVGVVLSSLLLSLL